MKTYRLDKFVVPHPVRQAFLAKVNETHVMLRTQPGFVRDLLLEQPLTDHRFSLATLVEWESEADLEAARAAVKALHQQKGFVPQEALKQWGITAEIGTYRTANAQLAP
jgi:heme-degrading monooxygenase HmoA